MTELTKKSIYLVKVCSILLNEEMDNIKGTTAYRQKIKNLTNSLSEELEKESESTYSVIDDEASQKAFFYVANSIDDMCEAFSNAKDHKDMFEIANALHELKEGNFRFQEENIIQ